MPSMPFAEGEEAFARILDQLCAVPMFNELNFSDLQVIARHMHYSEVEAGDVVFLEGERGHYVCFVVEGSLEVAKAAAAGPRTVLTTLSRGQSIGEMALIDEAPRSATVTALSKSRLLMLFRQDFEAILEQHPAIGISMLKGIARLLSSNLRRTSDLLAERMLPVV